MSARRVDTDMLGYGGRGYQLHIPFNSLEVLANLLL